MAKKKKLTPLQQEFKKEQTRIRNAQRRLEKQGFYFTQNMIPPLPRRVTRKALQEIKDITRAELIRNALWVSQDTGEIKGTGTQLEQKRRAATRKKLQKAGRRPENVDRLRRMSLARSGKGWASADEVREAEARATSDYYEREKQLSYMYGDNVVPYWERLWDNMESRFEVSDIVDALVACGGVPEPYGMGEQSQWVAYSSFTSRFVSYMSRYLGKEADTELKETLDNLSNAMEEDENVDEAELEDRGYI